MELDAGDEPPAAGVLLATTRKTNKQLKVMILVVMAPFLTDSIDHGGRKSMLVLLIAVL